MILTKTAEAVVRAIIQLRDYQQDAYDDIYNEWGKGHPNVLAVLPTGAGKTVLFSKIILDHDGASVAVAHRQELVSQISMALARNGVRHRIIGPDNVIRNIVKAQLLEIGKSFYDPSARCAVAGVDTLVIRGSSDGVDGDQWVYVDKKGQHWLYDTKRGGQWGQCKRVDNLPVGMSANKRRPKSVDVHIASWMNSVTLWVMDEAHHVLKANKWGKACVMFPNAKGLGVTATPCRADGQGLGRHHDGLFDVMVEGPTMRDLINRKFLTEYRVIAPPSDLDLSTLKVSKTTGDFNPNQMREAVAHSSLVAHEDGKSKVIGDVVAHYKKFAMGKLGVTFVPSVDIADEVAAEFNAENIPACVVSAKSSDAERADALRKFKNREYLQLVNVDLFGEGFDLPAIEVVSMARPTQSYSLYVQQFGRALRLLKGKTHAIIIDHVGNVARHKLPDVKREWTLDRRDKKSSGPSDAIPTRTCSNDECFAVYERHLSGCPYCGTAIPEPSVRNGPEHVDGDLIELDMETLSRMRGEVDFVDSEITDDDIQVNVNQYRADLMSKRCPQIAVIGNTKKFAAKQLIAREEHDSRKIAQEILRNNFAIWGGYKRASGLKDGEIYKLFFFKFNVDYFTSMTYHYDDAMVIAERLLEDL